MAGTNLALSRVLPSDISYRYNLGMDSKVSFIKNFMGIDAIRIPQMGNRNDFHLCMDDDKVWIVSSNNKHPIKVVLDSLDDQTSFGVGLQLASLCGAIHLD